MGRGVGCVRGSSEGGKEEKAARPHSEPLTGDLPQSIWSQCKQPLGALTLSLLPVLTVLFPPPLDHLLKFHSTWRSDT